MRQKPGVAQLAKLFSYHQPAKTADMIAIFSKSICGEDGFPAIIAGAGAQIGKVAVHVNSPKRLLLFVSLYIILSF